MRFLLKNSSLYRHAVVTAFLTTLVLGTACQPLDAPTDSIDLCTDGTANCYIAAPGGHYSFLASVQGHGAAGAVPMAPKSADLLWSTGTSATDVVSCVSFDQATQRVTIKTVQPGNAVVAVFSEPYGTGEILWSWHIWVTPYNPNVAAGQITYAGNAIMMDRHLGALSATPGDVTALGLLYQWGRKDPFIGAGALASNTPASTYPSQWPAAVATTTTTGTIAYATQHPHVFIIGDSDATAGDWLYADRDNTLWSSDKSLYDPCPVGWRVPDGHPGVWSEWPNNTELNTLFNYPKKGGTFDAPYAVPATWYPLSGMRIDNTLSQVGAKSVMHACSTQDTYATGQSMVFLSGMYYTTETLNTRATGASVRCCKIQ